MSSDPSYQVADALRRVALRLEAATSAGHVDLIDSSVLAETLLLIAEELDPPLAAAPPNTEASERM
jgi:hypothetical protein